MHYGVLFDGFGDIIGVDRGEWDFEREGRK